MTPTDLTPIGRWLVEQCERTIDLNTGKPITWRQASLQAGFKDPNAVWRFIVKKQTPTSESCYLLALFFSTAERKINPDWLLDKAQIRHNPHAPEIIPPEPEPLTDEEADAILAVALGEELYALLAEMISTPQGREELKWHLKRVLGK